MNSWKRWICWLALVLLPFGCAEPAASVPEKEPDRDEDTLVIGIDENYPPFGFLQDGQFVGFDISLAQSVCKELGMKLEVMPISWSDKEVLLEDGTIDAIWNGLTITDERERDFLFTEPYMAVQIVLVVRDDSEITGLDDLAGRVIGVQYGSYGEDVLSELPEYELIDQVTYFEDNRSALKNLYAGLTDGVIVDSALAEWYIYSQGANYKIVDSVEDIKIGVAFSRNNASLRNRINSALNELKEKGIAQQISMEWFGENLILPEQGQK